MSGIHTQPVNMKITEPHQDVLDKVSSYAVAPRIVEIKCLSPWRIVFVGKIRSKGSQIIPLGTQMIVYDIKNNGNTFAMAGIHQMLQCFRATIGILNTKRKDTIVTPIPVSGKL